MITENTHRKKKYHYILIICLSCYSLRRTVTVYKRLYLLTQLIFSHLVDSSFWKFVLRDDANYFGIGEISVTFEFSSRCLYFSCDPTLYNLMFVTRSSFHLLWFTPLHTSFTPKEEMEPRKANSFIIKIHYLIISWYLNVIIIFIIIKKINSVAY